MGSLITAQRRSWGAQQPTNQTPILSDRHQMVARPSASTVR